MKTYKAHSDTVIPHKQVLFVRTGEFRCPLRREWYLSGAIPGAYQAPNNLSSQYHILRPLTFAAKVKHVINQAEPSLVKLKYLQEVSQEKIAKLLSGTEDQRQLYYTIHRLLDTLISLPEKVDEILTKLGD